MAQNIASKAMEIISVMTSTSLKMNIPAILYNNCNTLWSNFMDEIV